MSFSVENNATVGSGGSANSGKALAALRQELHVLLQRFDAHCRAQGISYFAIGDTLVGALVYNDFVPGKPVLELGMLRSEYEKLDVTWRACGGTRLEGNALAEVFRLRVFDGVTDDYDIARFQLARVQAIRKVQAKAPAAMRGFLAHLVDKLAATYSGSDCKEVANLADGSRKTVPLADVAQTRRVPFGAGEVSVPARTDAWLPGDAAEERRRIVHVQADLLAIVSEIDRVCAANGIGYFICGGTLLGAVREGGFLPWDDDIDIGMLREDYERFLACAPAQFDGRFFLQSRATDPRIPYLYAKVRMNDTEYVTEYMRYRDVHKGISIDVFPFDRAPVGSEEFIDHLKKARSLARKHAVIANRQAPEGLPHREARTAIEVVAHRAMAALHRHYWKQSLEESQRAYEEHVRKFNDGADSARADYAVSYVTSLTFLPLECLLPYRRISFEGIELSAPRYPETFLAMQYGDFKTLPPQHERRSHRVISWKTSDGSRGGR